MLRIYQSRKDNTLPIDAELTEEERELLRMLLRKGARPEPEIGVGWGSAKIWVRSGNFITFIFLGYAVVSSLLFWQNAKDSSESHREIAFLISLSPEQRANLGIEMPESLARRLYSQHTKEDEQRRNFQRNHP